MTEDTPLRATPECPRCGLRTVVYNGNYFCKLRWCGWVLSDAAGLGEEYAVLLSEGRIEREHER